MARGIREKRGQQAVCPEPDGLHGWHFSYAMGTNEILSKMKSSVAIGDKDFGTYVTPHEERAHWRTRECVSMHTPAVWYNQHSRLLGV